LKQLPEELIRQLQGITGFDEPAFCNAHNRSGITSIRYNPKKQIEGLINGAQVPWCEQGRYLEQRPVFTLDPAYHAGAYYVQEASSMFTGHVFSHIMAGKTGIRVLDLCAAPGGKSTHIAGLLDADSLLISNDVIRNRATILEENMTRWGYMNTWVTCNDPQSFSRLPGYFDCIIVDAPCSGSGLFRKDDHAIDEWNENLVKLCAERQQRIIANVYPSLKTGGVLIYATCSFSAAEDEQMLDWMRTQFDLSGITVPCPDDWGVIQSASTEHQLPCYRFFPDKVQGEGFFIAALRKDGEQETMKPARYKVPDLKNVPKAATELFKTNYPLSYIKHAVTGQYAAINELHFGDHIALQQKLYFRKTGTIAGAPAGKDWVPEHEMALSCYLDRSISVLNLEKDQALKFLKKEDFGTIPDGKGWYLISYHGLGLGWIKALGNRINNYLPKSWRIRMDISDEF